MPPKGGRHSNAEYPQPVLFVTASDSIDVGETQVVVDTTDGAVTLTLPPVGQCIGVPYFIYQETADNDVVITDVAGSTIKTLSNSGDVAMVIGTPRGWFHASLVNTTSAIGFGQIT